MTQSAHKHFTVSTTSYLRNLDAEVTRQPCVAVHYQSAPKKTETGTIFGMRYPFLIVAYYIGDPEDQAEKIARILEAHWDSPEFNNG